MGSILFKYEDKRGRWFLSKTSHDDRYSWAHSIPPRGMSTSRLFVQPASRSFIIALASSTAALYLAVTSVIFSGPLLIFTAGLILVTHSAFVAHLFRPAYTWPRAVLYISIGFYLGMTCYKALSG